MRVASLENEQMNSDESESEDDEYSKVEMEEVEEEDKYCLFREEKKITGLHPSLPNLAAELERTVRLGSPKKGEEAF